MRHSRQSASLQGLQGRSMIFYHTSLVETRLLPLLRCHRRTNYTACHPTHSRTPCLEFFCAAKQGLDVCMLFLAGFLHLREVAGPHELAESTSRPCTCNYLFGIRFGRFPSAESAPWRCGTRKHAAALLWVRWIDELPARTTSVRRSRLSLSSSLTVPIVSRFGLRDLADRKFCSTCGVHTYLVEGT
jgi:hypothetical protein